MFKRCLRRDPDDISARYHLGLCQLLTGDYADGWVGFELRNAVAGRPEPTLGADIPVWRGEPLDGKALCLIPEQGLGDTIQFARFAKSVSDAGASVYPKCDATLAGLLATVPGVDRVIVPGDNLPDIDFQAPLLGLPYALGVTPSLIPLADGYLAIPDAARDRWDRTFGALGDGIRVGLAWAGNPDNKIDFKRSIPLALLQPLLEQEGTDFYSFQIGDAASEIEALPPTARPVFDQPLPLADVAEAMRALDLVITVDTSMAHLAGALGVPVWTLISYVPDWRWGLESTETAWYASMRLFRQTRIGDWSDVVSDVCDAMTSTVQARQAQR